jgi:hypothetical protein
MIWRGISWYFRIFPDISRYFLLFSSISWCDISWFWQSISLYFIEFPVWNFIYPSKKNKAVQDPVNKKTQVEQESCKNTKVFPSISCFWSCISWYFLLFPDISRYFLIFFGISWYLLIFQGISWNFLVFPEIFWYFLKFFGISWYPNENVCMSWCLTPRFWKLS